MLCDGYIADKESQGHGRRETQRSVHPFTSAIISIYSSVANPYTFSGASFCSPGEISNDVPNDAVNYQEMVRTRNQANEHAPSLIGSGSNLRSSATIPDFRPF